MNVENLDSGESRKQTPGLLTQNVTCVYCEVVSFHPCSTLIYQNMKLVDNIQSGPEVLQLVLCQSAVIFMPV
jgi:hypothetical protein